MEGGIDEGGRREGGEGRREGGEGRREVFNPQPIRS